MGTAMAGFSLRDAGSPRQAEEEKVRTATYLDVRTQAEWEAGHLDDAVHLELAEIEDGKLPNIPKDSEIKIYCRSGKRAETAKGILESRGFSKAVNAGGYDSLASGGKKTCGGALARCE
jgi:rhodanese-related sulfurtransferase